MTDRYPLDPRDEIRECSECNGRSPLSSCVPCTGRGYVVVRECERCEGAGVVPDDFYGPSECECWGTGFLPAADQRVIEVGPYENRARTFKGFVAGYNFRETGSQFHFGETKDEALLAARCAVWGVTTFGYGRDCPRYVYFLNGEESRCNYLTPNDALCAAIDAKEE